VQVSVTDEGPGISSDDLPKMYQKFQPLTEKPTGGESNTGLGLALSKILSEELKSKLTYTNRTDQRGSCFVLTFSKD
jgi:K+-sensing histidine kinase KdpD